jgi:hypothetical protein
MKLIITEEERSRILHMYQSTISRQNLEEDNKIVLEQLGRVDTSQFNISAEDKKMVDDSYSEIFQKTLQILKDNGIIFSIDQTTAAYIIVANVGYRGDYPRLKADIKVMDGPINGEKVLTTGIVTENGISEPNNPSAESNYLDIVKYANNFALYSVINFGNEGGGVLMFRNPKSGTLYFKEQTQDFVMLYGTVKTTPAQSKQEVVTTTWVVPETGSDIVKTIPGTSFTTGQITLKDSTELDKAINELNILVNEKNTKITSIVVESSSSGDRRVGGKTGYPNGDADLKKYPVGNPYLPKSANESGNATLAFGRGETIKNKLGGLGPVTIKPMIQTGGDAAQYAKLIVTIRKVDAPEQVMSHSELKNILIKKASTENLQGTKIIRQFILNSK